MSKDYAKPSTTRTTSPAPGKRPSPVLWLATLLLTAALSFGLYHLSRIKTPSGPEVSLSGTEQTPSDARPTPDKPKTGTSHKQEEEFSFYRLLPNTSVKPTHVDAYRPKKGTQQYTYLLQTGSFRNRSDAERQKARIAFQGLRAEISTVTGKHGTWHRVQVGPFHSRSKMNKAIDKLVTLNIQPLEKKIPVEKTEK